MINEDTSPGPVQTYLRDCGDAPGHIKVAAGGHHSPIYIYIYITNLIACYRIQFLTDHYNDPVSLCVYMCKRVSVRVSVFESLSAYLCVCILSHLLYSPCLSLATKTLTSSHLLIYT